MTSSPRRVTRRQFVGASAALMGAAVSAPPPPFLVSLGASRARPEPIASIQDPRVKALVQHALDVARNAGATYADVRLTYTKERVFDVPKASSLPLEQEYLGAGVRALVNGYWGFASSPVWSRDEMARLGREAVRQAKVNSLSKPREIFWPAMRPVQGHWETPVKIDAFTVHPLEIRDRLDGIAGEMRLALARTSQFGFRSRNGGGETTSARFTIQEKALGSTDGSYVTQRLHRTEGWCQCAVRQPTATDGTLKGSSGLHLNVAGAGWELFDREPLLETIRQDIEANIELSRLPLKPVEVGRYATVFDVASVAHLLSGTVGAATEIDRVMGYEANATGTSYLNAPDEMFGAFQLGNEHLTVTANRSESGGAATTQWDDEGAVPDEFTIVKNGVLQDFQTSREGAGWLRDVYARAGRAGTAGTPRSHGCAFADSGQIPAMVHTANLVMQPGATSATLQDLEAQMGAGVSFFSMRVYPDFQRGSGLGGGLCLEIKGGKRVARLKSAGLSFKTAEIWKNILALGGAQSAARCGFGGMFFSDPVSKGEPEQPGYHSVTAVPMTVRDMTIIDMARR